MTNSDKPYRVSRDSCLAKLWQRLGEELLPFGWLLVGIGLAASLQFVSASKTADSGFTHQLERSAIALTSDNLFNLVSSKVKSHRQPNSEHDHWFDLYTGYSRPFHVSLSAFSDQLTPFLFSPFAFFTSQNPRAPPTLWLC